MPSEAMPGIPKTPYMLLYNTTDQNLASEPIKRSVWIRQSVLEKKSHLISYDPALVMYRTHFTLE